MTSASRHEFLFWQPSGIQRCRVMPTTLENLNDGCGFSGTDSSMLEIASGLSHHSHGVRVLSGGPASHVPAPGGGVRYLSPARSYLDHPDRTADLASVDVFVIVYILPNGHEELLEVMKRLTSPRLKVVLWCHSIYTPHDVLVVEHACRTPVGRRPVPLLLVGVSDFVSRHMRHSPSSSYVTIQNAINPDIFQEGIACDKKKNSMIFCAAYERGGRIARAVHAHLQTVTQDMGQMNVCSYCDSNKGPSLSKRALSSLMRTCDFMVYPLVLDDTQVHHDTFACVVLEAMASGVLVVSWDVACLREVYGDRITLVPTPDFAGYDPHAHAGRNGAMLEPASIVRLSDAVKGLMDLPHAVREGRRTLARSWALDQTWGKRVQSLCEAVDGMS